MKMMHLINQAAAWILGKMTAVLQLTDTGVARLCKTIANDVKAMLRMQLKARDVPFSDNGKT